MKSVLTSLVLGLSGALSSAAQVVAWQTTDHDFGLIEEVSGRVTTEFVLTNVGADEIAITAVNSTCGCATTDFTRQPIGPGQSGKVVVEVNPANMIGPFSKRLHVSIYGEPAGAVLTLQGVVLASEPTIRLKYPVKSGDIYLCSTEIDFGEVLSGKDATVYIEMYNASTAPVKPHIAGLPDGITLDACVIPPGESRSMPMHFDARRARKGTYNPTVTLRPGNCQLSLRADII